MFIIFLGETCETLMAPCSSKPCKHEGVCQESEDYQSFSCVCPEGWQGKSKHLHVEQRDFLIFRCVTVVLGFFFSSLSGQTCEVDIKECVKSPCLNGATCQNTLGSYRCTCKPGFTGRNCETNIDDCKPSKALPPYSPFFKIVSTNKTKAFHF